ncbi:hypothetical protein PUNSTDRAFT_91204 [Punctularia strigosozonata HHB-11173 SS5]|uniref:uncharacterized protein n=1 Tax=Punctularia strigosozonata (strain HHB-11173) TaxID=741275 RepID=UPI00044166D0|nr:uncharacterized protein PUNSTDRAFT_91204 [Punctularia strigosozonata HHB-11173 SS5]EIN05644.1 hypothetical protein PUNSTDRAFT_91204 [Punctularia strigosozonata HHB-11173 SS5]
MFFHLFRTLFYVALWLFSAVLLGLTADRIHYTEHIPFGDPLNGGKDFYDPIVAELLVTSILTIFWVPFVVHRIHRRYENGFFSTFAAELIGLIVLFILWLVGAAIATHFWGDLHWCWSFHACRILTTLVAFAWLGTIMLFLLTLITLSFAWMNHAFRQPMHGRYYSRDSRVY